MRKKSTFYQTVLSKIVRCTPLTEYILLCNDVLFMHTTYRPSMFGVLLQFKDLISENMKIYK